MDYQLTDNTIIDEFRSLDDQQKNQLLLQMKQFIQQLQIQIADIEKSAIDIIVEKDEKITILEQSLNNRKSNNKDEEILNLKNHIEELNQRLEQLQEKHYLQLEEYNGKWNAYMLEQIQLNTQDGYNQQNQLLEQLNQIEEKNQKLERELEIQQNLEIYHRNEIQSLSQQNIQYQLDQEEMYDQILKLNREIDQLKFNREKDLVIQDDKHNKINKQLNQVIRQNQNLKIQMQKINNQNKEYIVTIGELVNNISELEQQLQNIENKDSHDHHDYNKTDVSTFQKTAQSLEQYIKEDINTTAFDLIENDEISYNEQSFNIIKQMEEREQLLHYYENYLNKSNKTIKEQNAQLQLVNQQLKIIRKSQFNQKNIKEYIKNLEDDYLVSKQILVQKQEIYEQKINDLIQENNTLKQSIRNYSLKISKKSKIQLYNY